MRDGQTLVPMMIAEPNRDVFEQLVQRIESDVDKDGWDQPNWLFRIDVHPAPIMGMAALATGEIPWPEEQGRRHPAEALQIDMTAVLALSAEELRIDQFVGVALAVESWGVETRDPDTPEIRRARERRELHLHPDRYELRVVMLIAPETQVVAYRRRGHPPEVMDMATHEGTVPEALRSLFAAFAFRRALEARKAGRS